MFFSSPPPPPLPSVGDLGNARGGFPSQQPRSHHVFFFGEIYQPHPFLPFLLSHSNRRGVPPAHRNGFFLSNQVAVFIFSPFSMFFSVRTGDTVEANSPLFPHKKVRRRRPPFFPLTAVEWGLFPFSFFFPYASFPLSRYTSVGRYPPPSPQTSETALPPQALFWGFLIPALAGLCFYVADLLSVTSYFQ